jgi:hypothetical protein
MSILEAINFKRRRGSPPAPALEASARVERKVAVAVPEAPDPELEREPVLVESEPKREHWVDGERVF